MTDNVRVKLETNLIWKNKLPLVFLVLVMVRKTIQKRTELKIL